MKRRRKSGVPKPRKRRVPAFPKNDDHAEAYAESFILTDIHRHPGEWVTAKELRLFVPGRYSVKLKKTLGRMEASGRLEGKGGRFLGVRATAYRVPEAIARVMKDAA